MILWLILFFLIIAISFVLAFLSMRDFQEVPPGKGEYGLFLIRKPRELNLDVLNLIHTYILDEGLIISLERLFKGKKSTLVIFGPKKLLETLRQLDLLELEDYTEVNRENLSVWEIGVRSRKGISLPVKSFFNDLPGFDAEEQFFWQLVLQARKDNLKLFQSQIRAVVYSSDHKRRKDLTLAIQNLDLGTLTKVPKPFTQNQIMDFYQQRSLVRDSNNPDLTTLEVLKLSLLS